MMDTEKAKSFKRLSEDPALKPRMAAHLLASARSHVTSCNRRGCAFCWWIEEARLYALEMEKNLI